MDGVLTTPAAGFFRVALEKDSVRSTGLIGHACLSLRCFQSGAQIYVCRQSLFQIVIPEQDAFRLASGLSPPSKMALSD